MDHRVRDESHDSFYQVYTHLEQDNIRFEGLLWTQHLEFDSKLDAGKAGRSDGRAEGRAEGRASGRANGRAQRSFPSGTARWFGRADQRHGTTAILPTSGSVSLKPQC